MDEAPEFGVLFQFDDRGILGGVGQFFAGDEVGLEVERLLEVRLGVLCIALFGVVAGEVVVVEGIVGVGLDGCLVDVPAELELSGEAVGHRELIDDDAADVDGGVGGERVKGALIVAGSGSVSLFDAIEEGAEGEVVLRGVGSL